MQARLSEAVARWQVKTLEDFRLAIDFESFRVSRRSAEQMQPSNIDDRSSKIFVPLGDSPT
jgi:hypothetical protein